jgi:hypothetical protein
VYSGRGRPETRIATRAAACELTEQIVEKTHVTLLGSARSVVLPRRVPICPGP